MFSLKTLTALLAMGASSLVAAVDCPVSACDGINAGPPCYMFYSPSGSCYNLPSDWNDKISYIKTMKSNYPNNKCTWYEHANCGGRSYDNQEDKNLSDGDGFFNDRISSWRCTCS